MPRFLPFLRAIVGLSPKSHLLLGRPVPHHLLRWQVVTMVHDRRLSAGIFMQPSRSKTAGQQYCLATWKSYQDKTARWHVTTSLFPDEIDPSLMLLQECRRRMMMTPVGAT